MPEKEVKKISARAQKKKLEEDRATKKKREEEWDSYTMGGLYIDHAAVNHRIGLGGQFSAIYTPYGLREKDSLFGRRIRNAERIWQLVELEKEIKNFKNFHPDITQNLLYNLENFKKNLKVKIVSEEDKLRHKSNTEGWLQVSRYCALQGYWLPGTTRPKDYFLRKYSYKWFKEEGEYLKYVPPSNKKFESLNRRDYYED